MGSSGAQFLGYVLGALSIIGGAKMATVLLVMGLPIMDVFWQAISRLLQGRSPFEGDRGHLHFRLVDLHFPQRPIVLSYYAFCLSFGMVTVFTGSRIIKLIALLSITLIGVFTFIWLIKAQAKQVRDEKNIA
jgi:UDP-GlcNAc:undecaprenyl-phosphate GlcNAc-1-phosphate transferase